MMTLHGQAHLIWITDNDANDFMDTDECLSSENCKLFHSDTKNEAFVLWSFECIKLFICCIIFSIKINNVDNGINC